MWSYYYVKVMFGSWKMWEEKNWEEKLNARKK